MAVNIKKAGQIVRQTLIWNYENQHNSDYQQVVPYLTGGSGIGKTEIIRQATENEYNGIPIGYLECNIANKEPSEVAGVLMPNMELRQAEHFMSDIIVKAHKLYDEGFKIGYVNLDEFPQGIVATQNASAPLFNDRMLGGHTLPDGWFIVATGNRLSDKAGTQRIPTHIQDRLCPIEVEPDAEDFCRYHASKNGDPCIPAFIRFKSQSQEAYTVFGCADPTQKGSGTARSWRRANSVLSMGFEDLACLQEMLSGTLGDAIANDFLAFIEVIKSAPELTDLDSIINNPKTAPIAERRDLLFVVVGALAGKVTEDNFGSIVEYCKRLEPDLMQVCLLDCMAKDEDLRRTDTFKHLVADGHLDPLYV